MSSEEFDPKDQYRSGLPDQSIDFFPPTNDPEILRVLAIGSRPVVNFFVHRLHQLNVAHFNEWSRLLPTPNQGEFMRILTKRIPLDREALPERTRTE
jgi:hypothetical protein